MERKEAITYLKEFFQSNPDIIPDAVTLVKIDGTDKLSVRIKAREGDKPIIVERAKNSGLAVIEETNTVILSKAKKGF